eukprot:UN13623
MTSLFRLTYFPTHGRALPIRLAAVLNGIRWEDCLIKRDSFMKKKQEGTEYTARWTGLPEATFFNQAQPITVGQSAALLRYVAQMRGDDSDVNYNLYPTNNKFDCLLVDEILDSVDDMIKVMLPSFMEQDEQKKLEMRKDLTDNPEKLPLFLGRYNMRITENSLRGHKHGYFVGDLLSIADLQIFSMLSAIHPKTKNMHSLSFDGIRDDFVAEFPRLYDHI